MSIKSKDGNLFVASVQGPKKIKLPKLKGWKYTDGLPEIAEDYSPDSAAWVGKSHYTT